MNTQPPSTTTPTNNACSTLLHDLNKGRVVAGMNESFTALVLAVRKYGKPGELLLKIKVGPAQGGDASRVTVSAAVTTKEPANVPYAGIYFTTEEGGVQKNDPEQEEFRFPRALPGGAPEQPTATTTAETAS